MTGELSVERQLSQKFDAEKQSLERTNRDLRTKVTELENSSRILGKAQIAALEAKIQNLEEQLSNETTERSNFNRINKRLEKRNQDVLLQLEDERRNVEQHKEQVIFLK